MDPAEHLVRRFYDELWNGADEAVAREILSPDFRFTGSLGIEASGVEGFLDYWRMIHLTFEGFECVIRDCVVARHQVAARMLFRGRHGAPLYDIAPTRALVEWDGAAFFETGGGRIERLWVLGDVDAVKRQLRTASAPTSKNRTTP